MHWFALSTITDRGTQFTSQFLKAFQNELETTVKLSTAFHLQMDGQAERTIQTLEYMLRACIIDFKVNWENHIPLIEFADTNCYHLSILMDTSKEFMGEGVGLRLGGLNDRPR